MAQHGGKRPGAGRKPGQVSKAKIDIAERAKTHGDAALQTLAEIMASKDEPASARVAAANALLDRGYGKPAQSLDHSSSDGSMTPAPAHIIIEAALYDTSEDTAAAQAGQAIQ